MMPHIHSTCRNSLCNKAVNIAQSKTKQYSLHPVLNQNVPTVAYWPLKSPNPVTLHKM